MQARVAAIEKWTAVADICRCLHNFNGVLQICAAFTNAAVFRLKKTWDKVPKTVWQLFFYFRIEIDSNIFIMNWVYLYLFCSYFKIKHTISKLQSVVCSDGRFRAMREALHRCDPPCIPYLGMYLTDLSFIEEGTPDFTPDGLLNFSKMRMVCALDELLNNYRNTIQSIEFLIAWHTMKEKCSKSIIVSAIAVISEADWQLNSHFRVINVYFDSITSIFIFKCVVGPCDTRNSAFPANSI